MSYVDLRYIDRDTGRNKLAVRMGRGVFESITRGRLAQHCDNRPRTRDYAAWIEDPEHPAAY